MFHDSHTTCFYLFSKCEFNSYFKREIKHRGKWSEQKKRWKGRERGKRWNAMIEIKRAIRKKIDLAYLDVESPVDLWPWMTSFWWFSNCWKLVLIWQVSFAKASMCVLVAQSCPTFCDSMDCSLPNSSVHGILQVRILECVAFSRGSLWPRDGTRVPRIVSRFFTICHQGSPFTNGDLILNYLFYLHL